MQQKFPYELEYVSLRLYFTFCFNFVLTDVNNKPGIKELL